MIKVNKVHKILIIIMLIIAVIFIAIIGISAVIKIPEKYGVGYVAMLSDTNIEQSDFNELVDYVYDNVASIRKLMEYDFNVTKVIKDEDFLFLINTLKFITERITADQLTQILYHGKTKKVTVFNAMTLHGKYISKNTHKIGMIANNLITEDSEGLTDNVLSQITEKIKYNEFEVLIKGGYSVCNELSKLTDKELIKELNNIKDLADSLSNGEILLSNTLKTINFAGLLTVNIENKSKVLQSFSKITDSELLDDLSKLDKTTNLACKIAAKLTADDILNIIDYYGESESFTYGLVKYLTPKLKTSPDLNLILSEIELLMDKLCSKINVKKFDLYASMLKISAAKSVDEEIDGIKISTLITQIDEFFIKAYDYYYPSNNDN